MERETTVTCYAGYKGDERPTSFSLEGRTLRVEEVVDRWYDIDYNCYRVVAEDGGSYLLRHDLNRDAWLLQEGKPPPVSRDPRAGSSPLPQDDQ